MVFCFCLLHYEQIERMEKLLRQSGEAVLTREFCQNMAKSFKWVPFYGSKSPWASCLYRLILSNNCFSVHLSAAFAWLCLCSRSAGRAGKPIVKWIQVAQFLVSLSSFPLIAMEYHYTVVTIVLTDRRHLLCYYCLRCKIGSRKGCKSYQTYPEISREFALQQRHLKAKKYLKVLLIIACFSYVYLWYYI